MLAVSPQRLNKILKTEKHVYFDLLVEMGVPELGRLGKVGMYETIKRDLENSLTLPSPCPPTLAVHHHHIWVLGRGLGHEGRGLMDKIGALIRDPAELPHPLMSCEDTERRCPPMNQEAGPQQTLDLPKP